MNESSDLLDARRRWLRGGALLTLTAVAGSAWIGKGAPPQESGMSEALPGADAAFATRVTLDPTAPIRPVNRRLLGANVQWDDRGDELLEPGALKFRAGMVDAVAAMAPTVLRYPGGTLGDTYHWKDGIGDWNDRGRSENFWTRQRNKVEFGTGEFLEFCQTIGAEPLITVNLVTGTAEEAAAWVAATNVARWRSRRDGQPLPPVRFWELGNEPYLKDDARPELSLPVDEFIRRAGASARAMRAVDPSIRIGLPTRTDTIGGMPMTPFKGFGERSLRGFDGEIDFVSVHNAYLPFAVDRRYPDTDLYWAAMAAPEVVAANLQATRDDLARWRPGRKIPIALTEYGAMFTLTQDRERTDAHIRSLAGAIYVADLLRLLSGQPDLLLAVLHSLSGNWHFGLISNEGVARPSYFVLQNFSRLLHGDLLPLRIATETFATGRVGVVPPTSGLPLVTGLAALDGRSLRALLINKALRRSTHVELTLDALGDRPFRLLTLDADDVFDRADSATKLRRQVRSVTAEGGRLQVDLPPHSLNFLESTET